MYCEKCGKKLVTTSNSANLNINSMLGELNFKRPWYFCRRCGEGHSTLVKALDVNEKHKVTRKLIDLLCDFAQRLPFGECSGVFKKHFTTNVSPSTILKISGDTGKNLKNQHSYVLIRYATN